MTITARDVEINLGRLLSPSENQQVGQWIAWAEATIAARMGNLDALDQDALGMVITEAVTARVRNPEPVSQSTISVDDGSVSKTYRRSSGLIEILPEWWTALGWVEPATAFSTRPRSG